MKRSIPYPVNALVSFHYFKDYDLDNFANLRLIGDSGAFSASTQGATITVKDLATWGKKWKHRLAWVAALDVIGDPKATYRNWREMVDDYGLNAVPTIHYGTDPTELDKYARKGCDFVGLGGLVGKSTPGQMRWLVQVFKYQRKHYPDMKFHGWGCTSEPHFKLPFYSVDSSSWTSSLRYGAMRLYHPRTGKAVSYKLDKAEAFKPHVARLLSNYYGTSPKDASYSAADNRQTMVRLSSLSMSVKERGFRRLHGEIPAPQWIGGLPEDAGPSIHLADASAKNVEWMNAAAGPHLHLANINPQLFLDMNHNLREAPTDD